MEYDSNACCISRTPLRKLDTVFWLQLFCFTLVLTFLHLSCLSRIRSGSPGKSRQHSLVASSSVTRRNRFEFISHAQKNIGPQIRSFVTLLHGRARIPQNKVRAGRRDVPNSLLNFARELAGDPSCVTFHEKDLGWAEISSSYLRGINYFSSKTVCRGIHIII